MMKRTDQNRIIHTIQLFLFTGIVTCLFYPKTADAWNRYVAEKKIGDYTEAVTEKSSTDGLEKVYEEAVQYNTDLYLAGSNHITEYMSKADRKEGDGLSNGQADDPAYESALSLSSDRLMGTLDIEKIGAHLPVYHDTTASVLSHGIGHLYGTSLPVGGENTHAVLTGHRGLPEMELFTYLDKLEKGDHFSLQVLDHHLTYQVIDIRTVVPDEVEGLSIRPGKDLVSLVTCTPYGVNTHRLIVTGTRVPEDRKEVHSLIHTMKHTVHAPYFIMGCALGFYLFVILLLGRIWKRKRCRKHKGHRTS